VSSIADHWYRGSLWLWLLWPLSLVFSLLVSVRRSLYQTGILKQYHFTAPIIVVGNLTVGGSGKTPLVTWLVKQLREKGYRPGVVSRGYGGRAELWPQSVTKKSEASLVGDEALLLARRCACPVVVGPDRVAAVEQLLRDFDVNIVVSDDGMQHYRMGRDIEIAVIDGERRLGNQLQMPAGPLREPPSRLKEVDFIVTNGDARSGEWTMRLVPGEVMQLSGNASSPLEAFRAQSVHAVAAIGNPARFFNTLSHSGLSITEHPFADHHPFHEDELDFPDDLPVIMTEKDAVKYLPYANDRHWYLPVTAQLNDDFSRQLLERLEKIRG